MQSFLKWLGKKLFGKNKKKPEEQFNPDLKVTIETFRRGELKVSNYCNLDNFGEIFGPIFVP